MATPTKKSQSIENLLINLTGKDRKEGIKLNICTWCGKQANSFWDQLSEKEYTISGFCQTCQDETFGK